MSSQNKTILILVAVIIVLCLVSIESCRRQIDTQNRLTAITDQFSVARAKDSSIIATQAQNVLTLKEAIKLGAIERERYMKDIVSQIKSEIGFSVREIPVPYIDSVIKLVYIDTSNNDTSIFVKTPIRVSKMSKYFRFAGTVKSNGFIIDSLKMFTDLRVTVFEKKDSNWFKRNILGKSSPVVEIKSSNPDTYFNTMTNVQIKRNKPFYKKWWFAATVGAITGILIVTK